MKTVIMTLAEFLNWEAIAFKFNWDYKVSNGQVAVTADYTTFQYFGYEG